ncbi:hypothetical protein B0H16DRAFT_1717477 [Mycena metata]|uniref:Uncharacterized protein n=1 Tax=Mycena metata TaxID=1033252 RepID=A0AAD7NLJ3_9AGAR|nr:hypothetical protein B0H16DRAFT_1717477 [Mycena metata]
MAPKRKTAAAASEDDPDSIILVAPDDPRAPWSAFWPNQACTDIIFYFDADHIENSEAQVVLPIINTLRGIMTDFFSRYPAFPWDMAAYVASLTAAVDYILAKHLPVERLQDYQDMLWEVPADIAGQLEDAGVEVVRDDFVLPRVAIREPPPPKKLPTWFSKPVKTEAPDPPKSPAPSPSKKPRTGPGPGSPPPVSKAEPSAPSSTVKVRAFGSPPARAPSVESSVASTSGRTPRGKGKLPATDRKTRSANAPEPSKDTKPPKASGSKPKKLKEIAAEESDKEVGPSTCEELLLASLHDDPSLPGEWLEGSARPFAAWKKAPHAFIRDFLLPMLWEELPIGCVSCDNRGIPCKLSPGSPRCEPCKKGGGKCSRAAKGAEQLVLLDRLRPYMSQSPDAFIDSIIQALHARRNAELHFRLLAHAMETLHVANDKVLLVYANASHQLDDATRNQLFEDPEDRVHIEHLVRRGMEKKSMEQRQLEHLRANPTSGVLRHDEAKPHSLTNSFHVPLAPASLAPLDPALDLSGVVPEVFVSKSRGAAPVTVAPSAATSPAQVQGSSASSLKFGDADPLLLGPGSPPKASSSKPSTPKSPDKFPGFEKKAE